jgi:hypothetical protein
VLSSPAPRLAVRPTSNTTGTNAGNILTVQFLRNIAKACAPHGAAGNMHHLAERICRSLAAAAPTTIELR